MKFDEKSAFSRELEASKFVQIHPLPVQIQRFDKAITKVRYYHTELD